MEEWGSGGVEEWGSGEVEEWRSGGVGKWRRQESQDSRVRVSSCSLPLPSWRMGMNCMLLNLKDNQGQIGVVTFTVCKLVR